MDRPLRPNAGATATLVINNDYSCCTACGGGSLTGEEFHERLLGHAGLDNPDGGCGARFVEVATDEVATPEMVEAIKKARPDLTLVGKYGFEGRA